MNNIHYLLIGLALLFAIVAIIKPVTWTLCVSVLLICIELFSRTSKALIVVGIGGALVFGVAGCKTNSNPGGVMVIGGHQIDPLATGKAVQIAAKYGALETIRQKPETRVYFQSAAAGIAIAISGGNYNPTNITATLEFATGNQEVAGGITDALSLYQDFFGKLVADKLDGYSPYTVPVLTGLAAGIQQAIDLTAP